MKPKNVRASTTQPLPRLRTKSIDALTKLLDSSLDVICSIDEEGHFLSVSAASWHLWGYEPEELEGVPYLDLVAPGDRPATQIVAEQIKRGTEFTNFQNRYIRKDGTLIPIVWSARWDEKDRIMYCVARDGREKQAADAAIRKATQKARLQAQQVSDILGSMQDGFFAMDLQWRITFFNREAEKLTGKPYPEVVGKVFWEVFPTAVDTIAYQEYHRAVKDQVQVNFEVYSSLFSAWYEVTAYPSKTGISVYFKNISARKQQQEEIRKLSFIARETPNAVVLTDAQEHITWVNKAFTEITGYEFDDVIGKKPGELLQGPNTSAATKAYLREQIKAGAPFKCEVINYTKSGREYWMEVKGQPILNEKGEVEQFFSIQTDITERKQIEKALQLSEERYRLLFEQSPSPKLIYDAQTYRIVDANLASQKLYGYNKEEFARLTVPELKPEAERIHFYKAIAALPKNFNAVVVHQNKWGDLLHIEISARLITLPGGDYYIVSGNDLTEKLKLQKQLIAGKIQAQKVITKAIIETQEKERTEIAKELHDNLNQIIATVKLYLDNIIHHPDQSEFYAVKGKELAELAIQESRTLAHQLITPVIEDLGFREAIDELLGHYQTLGIFKVEFRFTVCEDRIDKNIRLTIYRIIQECLNNIVKYANARKVYVGILYEDGIVKVIVKDDGVGFDPEQKGKGIGLTNILNRASLYNGTLDICSAEGKGTAISIHFPTVNNELVVSS